MGDVNELLSFLLQFMSLILSLHDGPPLPAEVINQLLKDFAYMAVPVPPLAEESPAADPELSATDLRLRLIEPSKLPI
jgi:hypothetical protein